jgi:hypothetical protein
MANFRRLAELGLVPLLAKEVAAAIDAGVVSAARLRRLAEMGMTGRQIRELRGQLANTTPRLPKRWAEIGIAPRLGRELVAQISGGTPTPTPTPTLTAPLDAFVSTHNLAPNNATTYTGNRGYVAYLPIDTVAPVEVLRLTVPLWNTELSGSQFTDLSVALTFGGIQILANSASWPVNWADGTRAYQTVVGQKVDPVTADITPAMLGFGGSTIPAGRYWVTIPVLNDTADVKIPTASNRPQNASQFTGTRFYAYDPATTTIKTDNAGPPTATTGTLPATKVTGMSVFATGRLATRSGVAIYVGYGDSRLNGKDEYAGNGHWQRAMAGLTAVGNVNISCPGAVAGAGKADPRFEFYARKTNVGYIQLDTNNWGQNASAATPTAVLNNNLATVAQLRGYGLTSVGIGKAWPRTDAAGGSDYTTETGQTVNPGWDYPAGIGGQYDTALDAARAAGNVDFVVAFPSIKGSTDQGKWQGGYTADGLHAVQAGAIPAGNDLKAGLPTGANVPVQPLTISGTPASSATVGTPYSFTPTTSGGSGTKTFALTGTLPAGLNFSTTTGAISGTPTTAQNVTGLNITVTDTSGSASLGAFSINVVAAGSGTVQRRAKMQFGAAPTTMPTGFQNVPGGGTFPQALTDTSGASTPWTITLTAFATNSTAGSAIAIGTSPDDFPVAVMGRYVSRAGGSGSVTFGGLDQTKTYRFSIGVGLSSSATDRTMMWTAQGAGAAINTGSKNPAGTSVLFDETDGLTGIVPNSSGQITLTATGTGNNAGGTTYVNGMSIKEVS